MAYQRSSHRRSARHIKTSRAHNAMVPCAENTIKRHYQWSSFVPHNVARITTMTFSLTTPVLLAGDTSRCACMLRCSHSSPRYQSPRLVFRHRLPINRTPAHLNTILNRALYRDASHARVLRDLIITSWSTTPLSRQRVIALNLRARCAHSASISACGNVAPRATLITTISSTSRAAGKRAGASNDSVSPRCRFSPLINALLRINVNQITQRSVARVPRAHPRA